jgi:hypothetical protein
VTILHIGLYHNWTYINEVEVYAFDEHERRLVGKTSIDQYYNEELVRSTTENLLQDYIQGQIKLNGSTVNHEQLVCQVKELVQKSYFSLLEDANTAKKLEAVKPLLLPNK